MHSSVRLATRADEPAVLDLARLLHAEIGMFPLDMPSVRATLAHAFDRNGAILGVIDAPGEHESPQLVGMILVFISHYWYTKSLHLEEYFNFVHPDHRHSDYAEHLITFARASADALECPLLIGVMTTERMEAKVRLYRRILGTPAGAFFLYNAPRDAPPSNEDFWARPLRKWRHRVERRARARSRVRGVAPHV
jgi:GNAT superfamily N-acetyltransferase